MSHILTAYTSNTPAQYNLSTHPLSNHINICTVVLGKDPREANAGKWSQASAWKRTGIQQNKT